MPAAPGRSCSLPPNTVAHRPLRDLAHGGGAAVTPTPCASHPRVETVPGEDPAQPSTMRYSAVLADSPPRALRLSRTRLYNDQSIMDPPEGQISLGAFTYNDFNCVAPPERGDAWDLAVRPCAGRE